MLESIRSRDDGGGTEHPHAAEHADPEPLRAGNVDDVVGPVPKKDAPDGRQGGNRFQSPPEPAVSRRRAEIVGKEHVAVVAEQAELFLQLQQHLRGPEPRVARIVTDQ